MTLDVFYNEVLNLNEIDNKATVGVYDQGLLILKRIFNAN